MLPFIVVFCLFLLCSTPVGAADLTIPGDYTLTGGNRVIDVSVSYTDDDNGNNSLLVEWDEDGDDWSNLLGSSSLEHAVPRTAIRFPAW
ncbi:MAG: hypothetical protein GXP51_08830 [Deltaproteobacteria bacterium]|nr:hypothetical protein [Deltaproteobacteria bacterium]